MSTNAMARLPCTDEVQNSFTSSGGRQTWSQDSESELDTEDQTTSLDEQDEQSELSDSKNNEMKLSKKWINYLKGKKTNSGRYQPHNKLQAEVTRVSNEELHACQSFCTIKINLIHHRMNLKERSSRHKKQQFRLNAEVSEIDALNCTVPDELLNRIYFKNTTMTLKQMEAAKQHILSQCPSCNKKRAELAQSAFLRQKKTLLESLLLEEKIDEHLHTTDFLTRVGEARQGLPRLLDDPRIIWKRLIEKAQIQYGGFER
ncbi:uncharacterized protein C8orf48 homolog [Fukomys damarensis]|uniref:Uncharacterized protein n=1 Tax=Fukomys damarensis TaxID=885580 RepID=A0A091E6F4_FUKDA|nr:uncharacterized protein C8orf48 homolog [Fukomys damarensis]KFO38165.1 hypothetical protein H920_00403 [Fukomys damarensis]